MKKALPAIKIPSSRTEDVGHSFCSFFSYHDSFKVPRSPVSVTSSNSIPSVLRTPDDGEDLHFLSSFSAIWDERLKTMSGFHANPHGPFPEDVEPPSPFIAEPEEPFAVLGSAGGRAPYFIGLPSPHEYDRFIHTGEAPEALRPKKLSTYKPRFKKSENDRPVRTPAKVYSYHRTHQSDISRKVPMRSKPKPMPPLPRLVYHRPEIATPQSALTFAAVWDPDQGMSTFSGARMFESTYKVPPKEKHRVIENTYVESRYVLPKTPQRSMAVASSTFDGLDMRVPSHEFAVSKSKGHHRPPSVDDEGFFETFSDSEHPDCEPHLPSRFSVTTTSTSNYIDVDFPDANLKEEPVPPIPDLPSLKLRREDSLTASLKSAISPPFLLLSARRPSDEVHSSSSSSSLLPPLTRSKSSPGSSRNKPPLAPRYSHQTSSPSSYKHPRPRLSNVLGRFRKGSQDEGWVSVEVTSVITDRIIKED